MDAEKEAELLLGAWQKTVDVQQHFNQIEMDIRKTAVTVVGAVVGAAGLVAEKGMTAEAFGTRLPLAAWILVAGAAAWLGFGFMDFFWYHRLLRGSVDSGLKLEQALQKHGLVVELTDCIGKRSPVNVWRWKLHTNGRMGVFYIFGVTILAVFAWGASSVVSPPANVNVPPAVSTATISPKAPVGSPAAETKKD
jgi:hypothetical protein